MTKLKSVAINTVLVCISMIVMLVVCEIIFRKMIFNENKEAFKKYKRPPLYAADWDENYWKLLQIWGFTRPKENPHPLLGWTNYVIWPNTLMHRDMPEVGAKRPVLIYGDSFSQHMDTSEVTQSLFKKDSVFSKENYFLNYACGAYGLDQMYTIFNRTWCKYERPLVIFSFLTLDLDRTALAFRDGQKPHYIVDSDGNLSVDTSKYIPSNIMYVKNNPPHITSYLWRKFLYSDVNFLPEGMTEFCTGELANREVVKKLNAKIIENIVNTLRKSKTDFVFLLWEAPSDYKIAEKDNWRIKFIKQLMKENNIKYFWAKNLIPQKLNINDSATFYKYYIPVDGHPTNLYYSYVIDRIKKISIGKEYESLSDNVPESFYMQNVYCHPTYQEKINSFIQNIQNDTTLKNKCIQISDEKHEPLDKSVYDLAVYFLWKEEESNQIK